MDAITGDLSELQSRLETAKQELASEREVSAFWEGVAHGLDPGIVKRLETGDQIKKWPTCSECGNALTAGKCRRIDCKRFVKW